MTDKWGNYIWKCSLCGQLTENEYHTYLLFCQQAQNYGRQRGFKSHRHPLESTARSHLQFFHLYFS